MAGEISKAIASIREIVERREQRIKALEAEIAQLKQKLQETENNVDIVHTGNLRLSRKKILFVHPTPTKSAPPTLSRRASVSRGTSLATAAEALSSLPELQIKSKSLAQVIRDIKEPLRLCFNTSTNALAVEYIPSGEVELARAFVAFSHQDDIDKVLFWARLPGSPVIVE
jgi:hypothetical protein